MLPGGTSVSGTHIASVIERRGATVGVTVEAGAAAGVAELGDSAVASPRAGVGPRGKGGRTTWQPDAIRARKTSVAAIRRNVGKILISQSEYRDYNTTSWF